MASGSEDHIEVSLLGEIVRVRLVVFDYSAGHTVFVRHDGKESWIPLEAPGNPVQALIARAAYFPRGGLMVETVDGESVMFEVPRPGATVEVGDRRVVYLDQNVWTAVADALPGGPGTNSDDHDAVSRLARWVHEDRVVLPLSSGHLHETTKWRDATQRRRVALALLRLTRGWTMRDPIQVRRDELHDLFRRELGDSTGQRARPVFTVEQDARWGGWQGWDAYRAPADLAGAHGLLLELLVPALVTIGVLLDPDAIDAPSTTLPWAEVNQGWSEWLDASERVEEGGGGRSGGYWW